VSLTPKKTKRTVRTSSFTKDEIKKIEAKIQKTPKWVYKHDNLVKTTNQILDAVKFADLVYSVSFGEKTESKPYKIEGMSHFYRNMLTIHISVRTDLEKRGRVGEGKVPINSFIHIGQDGKPKKIIGHQCGTMFGRTKDHKFKTLDEYLEAIKHGGERSKF